MRREHEDNKARTAPSKGFVAALYIPLMVPALLPLYFAIDQDDPFIVGVMIATTVLVLVANALVLVFAYRWAKTQVKERP